MGDIFVRYKERKGFWIPEAFIEVLSDYICAEFEKKSISEYSEALQEIYESCSNNRDGYMVGMVNIPYHRYIKSFEDEQAMIDLLNQVKATLQAKGEKIEIEELDAIENRKTNDYFKSPWTTPIYTSSFIATIDIMIKMLNGEWTSTNHGVWFKGFGAPDGAEQV